MTLTSDVDPKTPVLVGVGQFSEGIDDPDYRQCSPVQLGAQAARAAIADTNGDTRTISRCIDTAAAVRQFEISTPDARAPLGRSDNYPRSVSDHLGADPARAILDIAGGQSPQRLVTQMARAISAGTAEVALIFGSEAISTTRNIMNSAHRVDFSQKRGGQLDDRGYGLSGMMSEYGIRHQLVGAPSQYALFENARRARLGLSRVHYAQQMGQLFAPFTAIAARNPHAAAPIERKAQELVTVSDRNRMIADPYTRYVVARDQVNQAAAVLMMSVEAARKYRVPSEGWVFLHGHADLDEQPLLDRPDLSRGPASVRAVEHALAVAGIGITELSTIDLYSCFPIAVFNICDGLGLSPGDPRGLTVTGGLPFFGGAGNNYSMHAIAETVARARARPGSYGLVGANGGLLSKYSAGVYCTTPCPWRNDSSAPIQRQLDAAPTVPIATQADGWATIETYTVRYDRDGRTGIVIGRLNDGQRFVANTADDDTEMLYRLTTGEPIGEQVFVKASGQRNWVSSSREDRPRASVRGDHASAAKTPNHLRLHPENDCRTDI